MCARVCGRVARGRGSHCAARSGGATWAGCSSWPLGAARQPNAPVCRVNHVNQRVSVVKVVAPVGADLALAAHIPHVQLEAVLLHALDVKALRGHGVRNVLVRHLLHNGGLAGIVQAQHQDARLLVRLAQLAQQGQQAGHSGRGRWAGPRELGAAGAAAGGAGRGRARLRELGSAQAGSESKQAGARVCLPRASVPQSRGGAAAGHNTEKRFFGHLHSG